MEHQEIEIPGLGKRDLNFVIDIIADIIDSHNIFEASRSINRSPSEKLFNDTIEKGRGIDQRLYAVIDKERELRDFTKDVVLDRILVSIASLKRGHRYCDSPI